MKHAPTKSQSTKPTFKLIKKALMQYEDLRDTVAVIEAMQYEKEKDLHGIPWETLRKKLDKIAK